MQNHYFTSNVPAEISEKLKLYFTDEISYQEFLQDQEGVYQSIQASGSKSNPVSSWEGESSYGANFESQLELDEALARSLQELEDDFEHLNVTQSDDSDHVYAESDSSHGSAHSRVSIRRSSEDDIDPDNMTYEELHSLGEDVGHESKGLSDDIISRLPTFKFKTDSKKSTDEQCVICCSEFMDGAQLITLPCAHRYDSKCIQRWLKQNKACPVCQKEVEAD